MGEKDKNGTSIQHIRHWVHLPGLINSVKWVPRERSPPGAKNFPPSPSTEEGSHFAYFSLIPNYMKANECPSKTSHGNSGFGIIQELRVLRIKFHYLLNSQNIIQCPAINKRHCNWSPLWSSVFSLILLLPTNWKPQYFPHLISRETSFMS